MARSLVLKLTLPALALTLAGCSSLSFWSSEKKFAALPAVTGTATVAPAWQVPLAGKQISSLIPAFANGRVYVAHPSGAILVLDEKSGAVVDRLQIPSGKGQISGGVAVSASMIVVGTNKAETIALDLKGAVLWSSRVSSEVIAPAAITDEVIVVQGGDGMVVGLDAKTGARKWSVQRQLPALTVRSTSIPVAVRGAVFVGTPQGKLLAIDPVNGSIGWEATVATPKGASELERLIDVLGKPAFDSERICATAFQGRVACFDLVRGTLLWSRDIGSLTGPLIDNRYVYVTDDKGVAQAFDRTTGGTIWKQDVLAGRRVTGTAFLGDYYAIQDSDGLVHLVERSTGKIAGRGLSDAFAAETGLVQGGDGVLLQTKSGQVVSLVAR